MCVCVPVCVQMFTLKIVTVKFYFVLTLTHFLTFRYFGVFRFVLFVLGSCLFDFCFLCFIFGLVFVCVLYNYENS